MIIRSCTSLPSIEEQKDCSLTFPPEFCCATCSKKDYCEAYYGCENCYVDDTTSEYNIKTLFSCCQGSISSKEFQEYIQKKPQNINLRR